MEPLLNAPVRELTDAPLTLRSDRLLVEVARPGSGIYRGPRFDWTGFVVQVTLDGRHTFCGREPDGGTGTGGIGLCNEFGIRRAIGYDEARPGEPFPKLGVGLLTRTTVGPYRFNHRYPLTPFPMRTTLRSNGSTAAVDFIVDPVPCRGFAVRLSKRLTVQHNVLRVTYTLNNVGSRRIQTDEYNHNFLSLDGHPVGPDLTLRLPCRLDLGAAGLQENGRGEAGWKHPPTEPFYAIDLEPGMNSRRWSVAHAPSGIHVDERSSMPWSAFALYGAATVISPEAFVDIDVPPGESLSWYREYTYYSRNDRPPL